MLPRCARATSSVSSSGRPTTILLLHRRASRSSVGRYETSPGTAAAHAVYEGRQLMERISMRRYLVAAATVVVAVMLPSLAAAKGPASASISGPGLDGPLAIGGDGEGPGTPLGTL